LGAETDDWHDQLVELVPQLRRFAFSLTGAVHDADDLLQATVEKALRNKSRFEPGTNLRAWLFRICRNLWIDEWRGARGRTESLEDHDEGPSRSVDGERVLSGYLELAEVNAAMERIGADKREIIALVAVEGHSYREVAGILDIPLGTVMSRLARARAALQDELSKGAPGVTANAKGSER